MHITHKNSGINRISNSVRIRIRAVLFYTITHDPFLDHINFYKHELSYKYNVPLSNNVKENRSENEVMNKNLVNTITYISRGLIDQNRKKIINTFF